MSYYENNETPSQSLAYKFLDFYDDALNRDEFVELAKDLCPDVTILEAIWEIIDFLRIGG